MTIERIRKLEDGQVLRYRLGKHGEDEPVWSDWTKGSFWVMKQGDAVIGLAPYHGANGEYRESTYCEKWDTFDCESNLMQIKFPEDD